MSTKRSTKKPAAKKGAPAVKSGAPAVKSGAPAAKKGAPAVKSGAPAVKSGAPAAKKVARVRAPEMKAIGSPPAAHADPHDHLTAACERIAKVIAKVGRSPLAERAKERFDAAQAFKALVHVIVSQQLSGKAADTIFGRVEALGGGALPSPAELVAIPDEKLRAAGLSGAKTRGVKDLAARVLDGSLDLGSIHALEDAAVIDALTKVRGIGRWSAEMFLMFRMGRPDILSTGDLGLRKGMMHLFGLNDLPDPATMERLSAHWRPYRSVASWYLWRVAEGTAPLRRKTDTEEKAAKEPAAKKPAAKKPAAKKPAAKKPAAKKPAAKEPAAKKPAAKRQPSSKLPVTKKAVSGKATSAKAPSRAEQVLARR